ncbi:MAG: hypothetical protein IIT83_04480, partial [Bacteroidales bacterium]|nr:hypothetical protein [Bacteroidales bacterium]
DVRLRMHGSNTKWKFVVPPEDAQFVQLSYEGDVNNPKYDEEGAISPFNLGFLVELYLRVLGRDGIEKAEGIYRLFDTNLNDVLPPSFYESFSPNPPFVGIGSPMSAVTIATINRIRLLIDQF